jgi:tetratricopeptide (TPR) repeat protein
MKLKSLACAALIGGVLATSLWSQNAGSFVLEVKPGASLALGASANLYTFGATIGLSGSYVLPFFPLAFARAFFDYDYIPLNYTTTGLSLFSGGAAAGLNLAVPPLLAVNVYGGGGYYLGSFGGQVGSDPFVKAGADLRFLLGPSLRLGVGMSYRNFFSLAAGSPSPSLYSGLSATIDASFRLGEGSSPGVEIENIQILPLFPILLKFYDSNPIGKVLIRNREAAPVQNLTVSFFIPAYMDAAKSSPPIATVPAGGEIEIPIGALLKDSVLRVTEGAKASGQLTLSYEVDGVRREEQRVVSIDVLYRNALTWDDNRKAAAFVTAKDPDIQRFAKNVSSQIDGAQSNAINAKFRAAVGLFEGIALHGVRYAVDPNSSYLEKSKTADALDYIQFPAQTMTYRAGDCDDLSVLYASMLEAISIGSAFLLTPGHIFVAFDLGMTAEDAAKVFSSTKDLIVMNGDVWVPVEVTMVQDGFRTAWQTAAREWRDASAQNAATFIAVRDAWSTFLPVDKPPETTDIPALDPKTFLASYTQSLNRVVDGEIQLRVADLEGKIAKAQPADRMRLVNSLGVLYARFGLLDKAEAQFQKAAAQNFLPSMINLGVIAFTRKDYAKALDFYTKAARVNPNDPNVLLGLARTSYAMNDSLKAADYYKSLANGDPTLAAKYSYLAPGSDSTARASSAEGLETSTWAE